MERKTRWTCDLLVPGFVCRYTNARVGPGEGCDHRREFACHQEPTLFTLDEVKNITESAMRLIVWLAEEGATLESIRAMIDAYAARTARK